MTTATAILFAAAGALAVYLLGRRYAARRAAAEAEQLREVQRRRDLREAAVDHARRAIAERRRGSRP